MEDKIKEKWKILNIYKDYIKFKDDEIICVFEVKKLKKEKELKNCYRI